MYLTSRSARGMDIRDDLVRRAVVLPPAGYAPPHSKLRFLWHRRATVAGEVKFPFQRAVDEDQQLTVQTPSLDLGQCPNPLQDVFVKATNLAVTPDEIRLGMATTR